MRLEDLANYREPVVNILHDLRTGKITRETALALLDDEGQKYGLIPEDCYYTELEADFKDPDTGVTLPKGSPVAYCTENRYNFFKRKLDEYQRRVGHHENKDWASLFVCEIPEYFQVQRKIIEDWQASQQAQHVPVCPSTNKDVRTRKSVPERLKRRLQKEVDSQCPFCGSGDVDCFEIHHIDGDSANTVFENLIMVCPTCHTKITQGNIPEEDVYEKKTSLKKVEKQ